MELLLNNPFAYMDAFMLIFVRIISLFIAVPLFSNRTIPAIAKIGIAFFLSTIVIHVVDTNIGVSSQDLVLYAVAVGREFIVGWLIGFSAYLAYTTLVLAGQFVDIQIGFSMVNVFDPLSQIQISITGTFYYYLVLLLTVSTNAHYYFIQAIVRSFDFIPLNGMALTESLYNSMIQFFIQFFVVAIQIAAPFFFIMLVTNVILAILARTAPQMNLFVIGFPLKIILGLLVILITLQIFININDMIIHMMKQFMDTVIKGLVPA